MKGKVVGLTDDFLRATHLVKLKVSFGGFKNVNAPKQIYGSPMSVYRCLRNNRSRLYYSWLHGSDAVVNMNINMSVKSCYCKWTHARGYFFFYGKWIAALPQTSVSLLLSCFLCLTRVIPPFCWTSPCSWSENSRLAAEDLASDWPGMFPEHGNVLAGAQWEKTEHLWHFPSHTCTWHFTRPRNDYTSRICPLINITKTLHWPPHN